MSARATASVLRVRIITTKGACSVKLHPQSRTTRYSVHHARVRSDPEISSIGSRCEDVEDLIYLPMWCTMQKSYGNRQSAQRHPTFNEKLHTLTHPQHDTMRSGRSGRRGCEVVYKTLTSVIPICSITGRKAFSWAARRAWRAASGLDAPQPILRGKFFWC